ncbi:hypothetical protein T05_9046 [Trichinella murrelli]|uniref:Uncharacterized protein n=1 Tax=Trichinella murrelli TaxID=144512 RepID=A0A0V0TL16_9BILA|nr:hypothetical protein T05_9046 [Trichinella murrelli]
MSTTTPPHSLLLSSSSSRNIKTRKPRKERKQKKAKKKNSTRPPQFRSTNRLYKYAAQISCLAAVFVKFPVKIALIIINGVCRSEFTPTTATVLQ